MIYEYESGHLPQIVVLQTAPYSGTGGSRMYPTQ